MNKELLLEIKLSRVLTHFTKDYPVAIITTFRAENTLEQNTKQNKEFARQVRAAGYGYVFVDGGWIENKGTDKETQVTEIALFIQAPKDDKGKLFDLLVKASQKYNQDGFLYRGQESDWKTVIFNKKGRLDVSFDKISMDKMTEFFTKLRSGSHRGRSFVFENVRQEKSWIARLKERVDKFE